MAENPSKNDPSEPTVLAARRLLRLRKDLRDYRAEASAFHGEIRQFMGQVAERCHHCQEMLGAHSLDLNGTTPPSTDAPGLKQSVQALTEWRGSIVRRRRGTVTVAGTVAGGVLTKWGWAVYESLSRAGKQP